MANNSLMMGDPSLPGGPAPGLTIVGTDTKFGNAASVHTLTGVAANTLLVVTTGNQNSNQNCTVTSSPVLTWTKRVDAHVGGSPNAEIWAATFVAGGSITVTSDWGASVQTSVCYQLTGDDTIIGSGTVGLAQSTGNISVTSTRTNSIIIATSTNWNAPDGGVGGNSTIYRGTPLQSFYYRDVAAASFWHYYYPATNIDAYPVGYISPTDDDNGTSTVALEIRSLTGNGPTPDTTDPVSGILSSPSNTHNSINLSWTNATDNVGITGYEVYLNSSLVTTVTSNTYILTGLNPSTLYTIYVRAKDAAGNGDDSNTIPVTTSAQPVDTTSPSAFTLSSPSKTSVSINLSWTTATDNVGVSAYDVYLSPSSLINTVTPPITTYNLTGLIPSTTYNLFVRARDAAGNFTNSNTIAITTNSTSDTSSPTAPVLSAPAAGDIDINTVELFWTASTDNVAVVGYDVYISPSTLFTTTTNLSALVTGLSASTSYTFFVRARDAAGNTAQSNSRTVVTDPLCTVDCGQPLTFTALSDDYSRYWGGSEFWGTGELAVSGVPTTMHRYRRFTWCDWEGDTQGSYKFATGRLKAFFDAAIPNKQLVSFGLITNYPCLDARNSFHDKSTYGDSTSAYPLYLHNLMQGEATTDWRSFACNGNGHWVPNYNSPSYISRLNALYAALYSFLQTTHSSGVKYGDAVGYIDVRGVGSWGEWHHNATTANNVLSAANFTGYIQPFDGPAGNDVNPSSNGTFPSWTRVQQIIDAHTDNLPDWPLTTILNSLDGNFNNGSSPYGTGFMNTLIHRRVGQYLMDNGNTWGDIGWRRDQWGDTANYYLLVQNSSPITGVETRWQTAPVTGEPPGYVVNSGPGHMGAFPTQGVTQHASIVGNSNYGSAPHAQSMIDGFKAIGCILRLTNGGTVNLTSTQLIITLNWRNFGVSPQYNHWNTVFEIRNSGGQLMWSNNSSFDPFLFLPSGSSTAVVDTFVRPSLASGTYTLSVRLVDPNGYKESLQLGITGRQTNGSYILTTLNF